MIGALVADADSAVAEAAMALTLARGRRRDRFERLGAEFDDVAAEDAVALVYAVAAALRHGLVEDSDEALVAASQALLARHDEGRRLEARLGVRGEVEMSGRKKAQNAQKGNPRMSRCAWR